MKILRYFLGFCVWLGGMYLLAMINDALFAIFLGSSMIIGVSISFLYHGRILSSHSD
jgi:hypothetical protein